MNDTHLKSKKILIVDDEENLRSMLITILEDENFFNIITADCVKSALEICQQEKPDIAILDVMLPDGNGFELMDALRSFTNIPVIFLTAKDDIQDKYSGSRLGADDYITKPFMPKELIFRLNAVLRRCYKEYSPLIELHDCKINLANAQVIKNDEVLSLTAKEHDILETLVRNANHIVTISLQIKSILHQAIPPVEVIVVSDLISEVESMKLFLYKNFSTQSITVSSILVNAQELDTLYKKELCYCC